MKPTIWIFALEPIATRYTGEWHEHIPQLLQEKLGSQFNIVQVDGVQKNTQVTPGAFLNFSDTNYWKSSQLCNFLDHYNRGETSPNDQFLFTDFWNPTVIQLKYMRDLLGLKWTLHGMVHAGSYDSADALGQLIGCDPWVRHAEKSFFHAFDHNYFATEFHIDLFNKNLFEDTQDPDHSDRKFVRTGWPMEYMQRTLAPYRSLKKRDLILFPHRVAPEKQVEIFRDLAKYLPQYEFVVCQDRELTKPEYHTLLGEAKMVFSASLQETLGISTCSEGPILGAIPLAPTRLSYKEVFRDYPEFLYPSEWTESWNNYAEHRFLLVNRIKAAMRNFETLTKKVEQFVSSTHSKFFEADQMIETIKRHV